MFLSEGKSIVVHIPDFKIYGGQRSWSIKVYQHLFISGQLQYFLKVLQFSVLGITAGSLTGVWVY